jgi:L-lactate dehydrogenase complex protein LldG
MKMKSREKILDAISKNKPESQSLPEILINKVTQNRSLLIEQFMITLQSIGATVAVSENLQPVKEELQNAITAGEYAVNTIEILGAVNKNINISSDPDFLEPILKAYISGTIGVAENGAIWLEERKMINRLVPFICQHLVIVLDASKIVADMHEAYNQIPIEKEAYGVFLAGPSKTADIEQSLVIGAHGARSLKVYIIS